MGFAVLALSSGALAGADTPGGGVAVDGTEVTAKTADGKTTADVVVINAGASSSTLVGTVAPATCVVTPRRSTVAPNQSTKLTLTLEEGCPEDAAVIVDLDGSGPLPGVTVKPAEAKESDWSTMVQGAWLGVVMALAVAIWGLGAFWKAPAPGTPVERAATYEQVKAVVNARMAALEVSPSTGPPTSSLVWKELPEQPGYSLGSTVANLEAGWSFKDSWVSNISVAATAFITLATSADLFTAILGEKPDAALGVMTVSGLVAAVVIGVANTVVKVIGPSTKKVTVFGLLLSTTLVVFAAGMQAATVGFTASHALDGEGLAPWALALMLLVCLAVVVYGGKTLAEALAGGRSDALPTVPADALDAWEATDPWERQLVGQRIRQAYAEWLEEGSQSALPAPAAPSGARGAVEYLWAEPRASLL